MRDRVAEMVFGACRLDLQGRELWRGGQPQAVAPKVFDLLALLVERRQRVVSKDELLAVVWPGQVVSDGAIARAVMQARKAVGNPALIKTVHRIGYRFTGMADIPAAAAAAPALRLGLLPLHNRSGDPRLDWIELGLAAMGIQALDSERGLSVASLPEMLAALAPLPGSATAGERADAAMRLLGLRSCVQATLRRQGATLWLDYQGFGEPLSELAGSLCADDPAVLGEQLAQEIRAALAPAGAARAGMVSQDPFVNQAFARAGQMAALHQFRAAARLLEVVIEFEPAGLAARLAHLRALANLEDPATDGLADEVARLAAANGDRRAQAQALQAAGHALALAEGPDALACAAQRLEAATALAEPFAAEDWAVRIRLASARVALLRGDMAQARAHYEFVEAASLASANQFQRALAQDGRAWLESECGEWLKAHGLLEQALQVYRRHNLRGAAALTLVNLAQACAELGLRSRAIDHVRAGEALFAGAHQPHMAAHIAEGVATVYAGLGAAGEIERVLALLTPPDQRSAATAKAQWRAALALQARCAGRFDEARSLLLQALQMAEASGSPVRCTRRLHQWLELEIEAAEPAALRRAEQRSQAWLARHDDILLRAWLARCEAARRARAGDEAGALAALLQVIDLAPAGRLQALSRLDAAWLLGAGGDIAGARSQARHLGPWLEEHPLGRALVEGLRGVVPLRRGPQLPSLR